MFSHAICSWCWARQGHPVHFSALLDGKAPADDHAVDIAADGEGAVREWVHRWMSTRGEEKSWNLLH